MSAATAAPPTDALTLAIEALRAEQTERRVYGDAPWPDVRPLYVEWRRYRGSAHFSTQIEGPARFVMAAESSGIPPRPIDGVRKKRERFDPLPHGQVPCPRCDGDDRCGFCDGSGIVGDASCWVTPHPEHRDAES